MVLVRHPDAHSISQEMRVLVRRNAAALGRVGGGGVGSWTDWLMSA